MINNLIDDYKKYRKKKVKRGYEVVGTPLTITYFVLLLFSVISFFLIIVVSEWFLLAVIILFILVWIIDKKVEGILKKGWLIFEGELKDYISLYLKEKGIILSEQFKNLSNLLKEKSEKKYKRYDLNPYLAMVVTIIIFILSISIDGSLKSLIPSLAISGIIIIASINPIVNTFANIFLNRDSERISELAGLIDDLYFEVSIKEVKD